MKGLLNVIGAIKETKRERETACIAAPEGSGQEAPQTPEDKNSSQCGKYIPARFPVKFSGGVFIKKAVNLAINYSYQTDKNI
jgi:hypothetical protein